VLRAGRKAQDNYDAVVARVRHGKRVVPDETGWRVGGRGAGLHAFATPDAVAYHVDRRRGFEASAAVPGEDYDGTLVHDGGAPYLRFWRAGHRECLPQGAGQVRERRPPPTRPTRSAGRWGCTTL
jgi:hypothetical protein